MKLASEYECTGCGACVESCKIGCLSLVTNEEGFAYPNLIDPTACIECHACENSCPILNKINLKNTMCKVYAAIAKNEAIRMESSSGGIFSILALSVLQEKGIVYGAAYNDSFNVNHIRVDNTDQLFRLRGAKYSQSNLLGIFPKVLEDLKKGSIVLFSGTPCQIAGLKSFLAKPYINLITIDFVCHGVPSPKIWNKYVLYRAKQDNNGKLPNRINLRNKNTGWSKYSYSNEYFYSNTNVRIIKNSSDLFMQLFVKNYINRKSCSHCNFKNNERYSDLTLGDFWGIWDLDPKMDDNKGTSLVILNTDRGKRLFEKVLKDLIVKEMLFAQACKYNSSILDSSTENENKKDIMQKILAGEFDDVQLYMESIIDDFPKKERSGLLRKILDFLNY